MAEQRSVEWDGVPRLLVSSRLEFELPGSIDAADATCCDKVAPSFDSTEVASWNEVGVPGIIKSSRDTTIPPYDLPGRETSCVEESAGKREKEEKRERRMKRNERESRSMGQPVAIKISSSATWVKRRCKGVGGIIRMLGKRYLRSWRSRMLNEAPGRLNEEEGRRRGSSARRQR